MKAHLYIRTFFITYFILISLKKGPTMTRIFNFPYINLDSILTVNQQTYSIGTQHQYQKQDTSMLIYVKAGQILLHDKNSYIINPNELLVVPTDSSITFTAAVPDTVACHLIFQASSPHLDALYHRTFTIDNQQLLNNIEQSNQQITFLRQRKPEIAHDIETGELFTILCSLLYTDVTRLLLILCEIAIQPRLPHSINIQQTIKLTNTHQQTTPSQLAYAKSTSGPLYKNLLVNQVIAYLKKNLDQTLTIEEIAQKFLVGSSNLKKIFKAETDISLIAYFKQLKIEMAKKWITQHQISFTEIANQLGFSSIHHFSTTFKNTTGLSPTQYYEQQLTHK